MKNKDKLLDIDKQSWPEPVKARAKELLKANAKFSVVRDQLKQKTLYSKDSPAILLEGGRLLQRLSECYKALAQEVAFHVTTDR